MLAFGNRARLDLIPGMAEHVLAIKTVGDAMHFRNMVLRRLARIELESSPAGRRHLRHFAVIGGGFSGIEVAGELVERLRSTLPFYRGLDDKELGVTVIHNIDRLLPELPSALSRTALASLRRRGVDVRPNLSAAEITADGLRLGDGSSLVAATVISPSVPGPTPWRSPSPTSMVLHWSAAVWPRRSTCAYQATGMFGRSTTAHGSSMPMTRRPRHPRRTSPCRREDSPRATCLPLLAVRPPRRCTTARAA